MSTGAGMPPRAVLGLTAAVLAAHLWLLQRGPPRIQAAATARPAAFNTRSIAAALPPLAAAAANPRPPGPLPRRPAARLMAPATRPAGAEFGDAVFEIAAPSSRPRVQHSAGSIGSQGLEPARFGDRHRGEQAAHFDRAGQRVVFSNNRPAAPLAPGAQDRLSVLLQLAALAAGSPDKFTAGARVAIQTATTREADSWIFTVEGEEELQLPAGQLAAVKLTRPPRGEFDQRVEVWLAPGQAYVPVRLRLTQPSGDWVDHQWSATDRR